MLKLMNGKIELGQPPQTPALVSAKTASTSVSPAFASDGLRATFDHRRPIVRGIVGCGRGDDTTRVASNEP